MPNHLRKCWDCGSVAEHSDNVVPEVLCKKCGSQDTRIVKTKPVANATPRYFIGTGDESEPELILICDHMGSMSTHIVARSSRLLLPQIQELVQLANIGQLAESKESK